MVIQLQNQMLELRRDVQALREQMRSGGNSGSSGGSIFVRPSSPSGAGGGDSYTQNPIPTLITPSSSMPPVTGIQYFRCLRENGRARSLDTTIV